jgi:hypothetical protein
MSTLIILLPTVSLLLAFGKADSLKDGLLRVNLHRSVGESG